MTVVGQTSAADLSDPKLYLNRELSLLEFNRRVLEQAKDTQTPLLERLKFLAISSTNLDEFFEVRVAGLKQQIAYGVSQPGPDGLSPEETLKHISQTAHELVMQQYTVLNELMLPELEEEGIRILPRAVWKPAQVRWIRDYFRNEALPVLTPMGLDPAHPFPRVVNKSLNFIVSLRGRDAFGRESGIAVVPIPRSLPRLIPLPAEVADGPNEFVLLSSVIHAHVEDLFPGMEATGCYQFRVTRNSDLWVDEEEVDDLMHALKGQLQTRGFGEAVRLELADNCSEEMEQVLLENFELQADDIYRVMGPVNLHRLSAIYSKVERPDLKYRPFVPGGIDRPGADQDLFKALRKGDLLLHHPFQSFAPVVKMLKQAARDPDVLAIKQTLYRTGDESALIDYLREAALNGKEVTVLVELRARFDEAANIQLATDLQEAGAKVVYGIVGYKAHSKMLMVVRREADGIRRYVHLGTGNYHLGTSRAYTDISYMTSDPVIGEDVHKLFMQLTGLGRIIPLHSIIQSPFRLQETLLELIQGEIENARAGQPARIMARMNSLSDRKMIHALYEASQAGVKIELIVRGICCLKPGIPGISDNIAVRSIVDRFLEHSRVFYFLAGGRELTFCSSADWMPRNLYKRVETCFPIADLALKARVVEESLVAYLEDDSHSWLLQPDGRYIRSRPTEGNGFSAQRHLLDKLAD